YGVGGSRYKACNNVVAANVITATARVLALALQMSLDGIQVITHGCTYCRDQIPAGTFAECLAPCPHYPIHRPGLDRGPFLDPATVPEGDAAFSDWYRGHVQRFFGVSGPEYDHLFGLHALEHKTCGEPERVPFDGLCCDDSGNNVKLLWHGDD